VREVRGFRALHDAYRQANVAVAGVTLESPEANAAWVRRLELPFPMLSDSEREAGRAFHVVRHLGIGAWGLELFRRATFLIDMDGVIEAVWERVRVRSHPREVLDVARALERDRGA
jgi:peroxiredoxin Q/BCP